MATYKVIQDIEAEDKLVGPLTLRQFIYACVAALCGYLTFIVVTKGVAFVAIVFLPAGLLAGFFAFPWGRDQPTEVWALAKVRFYFKPHRRIWDQSGVKELVNVTAPKRIEANYTNGLSQSEVRSRLRALADTIDSRGWAIKNVNVNLYNPPVAVAAANSDRLIDPSSIAQEVPSYDISASDDILDENNSPVAQHFTEMIATSTRSHRDEILQRLRETPQTGITSTPMTSPAVSSAPGRSQVPADNFWFLNQPAPGAVPAGYATFQNTPVVTPSTDDPDPVASIVPQAADPTPGEEALIAQLAAQSQNAQQISYGHLRTIQPLSQQQSQAPSPIIAAQPQPEPIASQSTTPHVTQTPDPAILELAKNNDLNVATIAREAKRAQEPQDEVVISLR